jgi:predicted heme/steroid binding protein
VLIIISKIKNELFTKEGLKEYNGVGRPAYVACEGKVYGIFESLLLGRMKSSKQTFCRDLTFAIAKVLLKEQMC